MTSIRLKSRSSKSVFSFMRNRIEKLRQQNKIRTSIGYNSALNSFMKFRNGEDLSFMRFDADLMEMYEAFLKTKGLVKNSTSFYMRIWRTVYNLAIDDGYATDKNPFRHVYTGIDKTVKRAISYNAIRKIKEMDLRSEPKLDFARDIFLFSFYTRGMSFIDMAYLKKSNIHNGMLCYNRKKTGQKLTIQWEDIMQKLVSKYEGTTYNDYLLPLFQDNGKSDILQCNLRSKQICRSLRIIADRVGINIPLTLYVARHSWASIARGMRISTYIIKDALGHDSEKTTEIYLASIDTALVDKANHKILNGLM